MGIIKLPIDHFSPSRIAITRNLLGAGTSNGEITNEDFT